MTGTEEGAAGEVGGCASEGTEVPRHDVHGMMCERKKGGCTSLRILFLLLFSSFCKLLRFAVLCPVYL